MQTKQNKLITVRRILGVIFSLLTVLFAFWAGWCWLLALPLIIDYYFLHKINWGWYKSIRTPLWRSLCSLLFDLVFCVVAVSMLNTYLFQNFIIPSSSLEKTFLVGDYLYVDKIGYGPRMPNTPLAIPLVHNTIWGHKSYSEKPHLKYRRLSGTTEVKRGDIVVFNFPAGDTVALNVPNPDYYTLVALYGREAVWNNTQQFGEIVYRPVDRRDHYVKRCVGMPGDQLEIRNNDLYINGKKQPNPHYMQLNYLVQTKAQGLSAADFEQLGVSKDDISSFEYTADSESWLIEAGFSFPQENNKSLFYHIPLTQEMYERLKADSRVIAIKVEPDAQGYTYPVDANLSWSRDNYGPLFIPKKGAKIELTPQNIALYKRCITAYEGHTLDYSPNGMVRIDGEAAQYYTFEMDYYFMMGDNRHKSADSRYWGFVPEDHIVGKPAFLWLSLDKDKSLFGGKIRWSRMFRRVTTW